MKNLFKTSIMRKCFVFGVVLILTLTTFPMYAFADDDPGELSPGDRYATDEEIQQLDSAISETSHNLALLMASDDPVRATDYEQATYNLLSSVFGSSTSSWASIVATRLGYLSTINSSANSLVVKLTGFYNSINPDYDTTGISMYDVVHGLLTSLTTIDPDDGDLTIIETLVYIHTKLEDLETSLSAILNSTYSIDAKIVNLHNFLINFRTDMNTGFNTIDTSINTGFTNVNANMATIINRLQSMQNDYNNLSWVNMGSGSVFTDNSYSTPLSNSTNLNNLYISFPIVATSNTDHYIYKFYIPVVSNSILSNLQLSLDHTQLKIGSNFYDIELSYSYEFDYLNRIFVLYIYNLYPWSGNTTIYLDLSFSFANQSVTVQYNSNYNANCYYISSSNIDFYTISDWLNKKYEISILNKFQSLYASDDLIAAKEDQQVYEDQAIQDFTGSGSAAASGSDLTDMKSISGALKQGLSSGGSVSNALSPFNTNSGFWAWFSQSNYDDINNLSIPRFRAGNPSNELEIIDFYNDNQFTLHGLLSGGGN